MSIHITMVKKRLLDGSPCPKCVRAEELLRSRDAWSRIEEVIWAQEGDADSPGMQLAREFGVEAAPFFIVRDETGVQVYESTLRLLKERLSKEPEGTSNPSSQGSELTDEALAGAGERLAQAAPEEILRFGLEQFGADCAIAFSGAEDVVLIDMASKLGLPFSVFCLDTGRLHRETYAFLDRVRDHYGVAVEIAFPNFVSVEDLVRSKGLFSFYRDGHEECCEIRKVEPLSRILTKYKAWVTGQRRDQSPATRSAIQRIARDAKYRGKAGPLLKLNPLATLTLSEVWQYIREHQVPYNSLHDQGFVSIGCEPCTRAPRPGEHERAGRWWWEETTKRECGLHIDKG